MTTDKPQENPAASVLARLFPGEKIKLEIPNSKMRLRITVWPIGIKQLGAFTTDIANISAVAIGAVQKKYGADASKVSEEELAKLVISQILPFGLTKLMPMVFQCVYVEPLSGTGDPTLDGEEIDPRGLPHWMFPPILLAWIKQSFGEELQRRPWIEAVELAIHRLTGKTISISEAASRFWSEQVSPSGKSSTTDNPEPPTTDGPTPSSDSISSELKTDKPANLESVSQE